MKKLATAVVAFLAYWCGADALFYWLNRRKKRILTFHNILPDALFRRSVANEVSNSESEFRLVVRECAKKFRFSTDLFDPETATITFDDGYRNQYTTAFRVLRESGIPAYVFVAGEAGGMLTVDKLLHWVSEAPAECIPGGDRLRYWIDVVWPRFMADSAAKGGTLLAELDAKYPFAKILESLGPEYVCERLGGIAPEELDEMRSAGWLIGWHTKTHYPLSRLDAGELRKELAPPPQFRGVCLSYPYGNEVEVGALAVRFAEEAGYPCAVSDAMRPGEPYSRWFLPRMAFLPRPDKYGIHFELSGFKHFLKFRRLLPAVA